MKEKKNTNYMGVGIALGADIGAAIEAAIGNLCVGGWYCYRCRISKET